MLDRTSFLTGIAHTVFQQSRAVVWFLPDTQFFLPQFSNPRIPELAQLFDVVLVDSIIRKQHLIAQSFGPLEVTGHPTQSRTC